VAAITVVSLLGLACSLLLPQAAASAASQPTSAPSGAVAVAPSASDIQAWRQAYASYRRIPLADVGQSRPGSAKEAQMTQSGDYWATSAFLPGSGATGAVLLGFQGQGSDALFERTGNGQWQVASLGSVTADCGRALPAQLAQLWQTPPATDCSNSPTGNPAAPRSQSAGPVSNAANASTIATTALSQVGTSDAPASTNFSNDCNPYTALVGVGASSSGCDQNAYFNVQNQNEEWCADFTKWVWQAAGVANTYSLTPAAASFYGWAEQQGESVAWDPAYPPAVGDAVVFYPYYDRGPNASYADHVGIMVGENSDGSINLVNGDFLDTSNIDVQESRIGSLSTWASEIWGTGENWIYVSPQATGTPPPPALYGQNLLGNADWVQNTADWGFMRGMNFATYRQSGLPEGGTLLEVTPGSTGTRGEVAQAVGINVSKGQSYDGSVRLRSASGTISGTVVVWGTGGGGTDNQTTPFTVGTGWTEVSVPYVASTNHTGLQLSVYLSGPANSNSIYELVDARLSLDALANSAWSQGAANWYFTPGMNLAIYHGPGLPEGNTVLETSASSAGSQAQVEQTITATLNPYQSYDASVWLRAASGTLSGTVTVAGLGGGGTDSQDTPFSVGATWTQVNVPYVATTYHTSLELSVNLSGSPSNGVYELVGARLDLNALTNGAFEVTTTGWGFVPGMNYSIAHVTGPAGGNTALQVSQGTVGTAARLAQAVTASVSAGQSYYGSVWLRASSGTVSGSVDVWGISGGPSENGATAFTVGTQWTQVSVPFVATTSHSEVQIEIYLNGSVTSNAYQLAGASLSPAP
jgi:hypothetical protein